MLPNHDQSMRSPNKSMRPLSSYMGYENWTCFSNSQLKATLLQILVLLQHPPPLIPYSRFPAGVFNQLYIGIFFQLLKRTEISHHCCRCLYGYECIAKLISQPLIKRLNSRSQIFLRSNANPKISGWLLWLKIIATYVCTRISTPRNKRIHGVRSTS